MSPGSDPCKYVQLIFTGIQTIQWGTIFSTNGTSTIEHPYAIKKKPQPMLAPYGNIYSKWSIDIHMKPTTTTLLQENTENICDLAKDFSNATHKAWCFKEKNNKLDTPNSKFLDCRRYY